MTSIIFGLSPLLVVSLSILLPEKAAAGPPDRDSGRMVLDEVEDALYRYRMARTPDARLERLEQLGSRCFDPRVRVVFGEALNDPSASIQRAAAERLIIGTGIVCQTYQVVPFMKAYWKEHEADLRRQAKQLPR
jgi:hypothetical protein